jgi:4-amino-4-deoxy-L-arabinose transferase-like glycosyltransferase
MMAAVNNDALAELLIAGILLLLLYIILSTQTGNEWEVDSFSSSQRWKWLLLGFLLGLGFLTKVTVYILVPVILVVQFWLYRGRRPLLIRGLLLVFVPALVLGLVWWIRNILVYDNFDPLGNLAHNTIVVGQPRTAEWLANLGTFVFLEGFFQTTFQSFWGQFGWMGVPMPTWVYGPLLLFSLVVVIGLIWHFFQTRESYQKTGDESGAIKPKTGPFLMLIAVFILSASAYIAYNVTFVQHQGRYLFPALVPISLGVAVGIAALMKPLIIRWPNIVYLLPLTFAAALILLDLLALFRFIVPSLT